MARVLAVVATRIRRLLERHGHGEAGPDDRAEDAWSGDAAGLAGVAAASVQGRAALGARAGARTRRIGSSRELLTWWTPPRWSCHAQHDGYDLHAGVLVPGQDRARLQRVCRYALRLPLAADRVQRADDGDIILALRHSWADGTTHLRFDPIELLERLAALTLRCSSGRSRASSRDHPAPADQSGAVCHLQTIGGRYLRRLEQRPLHTERVELSDGDFVDLQESPTHLPADAPVTLTLLGLEGSARSNYVTTGGASAGRQRASHNASPSRIFRHPTPRGRLYFLSSSTC
jgi:hypothetical protein